MAELDGEVVGAAHCTCLVGSGEGCVPSRWIRVKGRGWHRPCRRRTAHRGGPDLQLQRLFVPDLRDRILRQPRASLRSRGTPVTAEVYEEMCRVLRHRRGRIDLSYVKPNILGATPGCCSSQSWSTPWHARDRHARGAAGRRCHGRRTGRRHPAVPLRPVQATADARTVAPTTRPGRPQRAPDRCWSRCGLSRSPRSRSSWAVVPGAAGSDVRSPVHVVGIARAA